MEKEQLRELLNRMTLDEKLGQLTQLTGEHFAGKIDDEMVETGPAMEDLDLSEEQVGTVGSVLGSSSAKVINLIQEKYLERSRLKIPLLFMHDAIHGYRTIFPIPLGLSCSWDSEIVKKVAAYTATELRAAGIQVNFSPMTDLVRDSRWGRVMEAFGEDHILSGRLGKAMIDGYQKEVNGRIGEHGVAACLKHFAAYGAVHAGKDYASVDMSLREFFGYYARPYEIALEAKPRMVMSSFNSFNGEPVTASKYLLKEVLRDKFQFEGIVISDWGAVAEIKSAGVAENDKEAATEAFKAGVDIEMVSSNYLRHGADIVNASEELQTWLDAAVLRILTLKNNLGLFENPYVNEEEEAVLLRSEEAIAFAKQAAVESCVLLKNEKVLPINASVKNILILGPFAKTKELMGGWSCKGRFEETISLEEGIRTTFQAAKVNAYEKLEECPADLYEKADIILLTIGEPWYQSGEGHSSTNIELAAEQQELVREVKKSGKNFACIGFSGRPLALESVIEDIPALLWCWYLGNCAGTAVAELISGAATPSGKLTMSFPRVTGQTPLYYNEYRSGKPANDSSYSSRYQDCEIGPLYSFGHGLSYADIEYSNIQLSAATITEQRTVQLSMEITNNSEYDTKETVILYMDDPVSKNVRPVKEMLDYQRITLPPYTKKKVVFDIKAEDMKYINNQLEKVLEPGEINLYLNDGKTPIGKLIYVS
jgi:beta-glucosidase